MDGETGVYGEVLTCLFSNFPAYAWVEALNGRLRDLEFTLTVTAAKWVAQRWRPGGFGSVRLHGRYGIDDDYEMDVYDCFG